MKEGGREGVMYEGHEESISNIRETIGECSLREERPPGPL